VDVSSGNLDIPVIQEVVDPFEQNTLFQDLLDPVLQNELARKNT
jgi:hypothetical protein